MPPLVRVGPYKNWDRSLTPADIVAKLIDWRGDPLVVPERYYTDDIVQFAHDVSRLNYNHCSFPDGQILNRSSNVPCRGFARQSIDGRCRAHGKSARRARIERHAMGKTMALFRHLPRDVAAKALEAYNDERLLSLREDASLIIARQMELAERLYTGESGELWHQLKELWATLQTATQEQRRAVESGDQETADMQRQVAAAALQEIGETINRGADNEETWRELQFVTNQVSQLKSAEHKRLVEMSQVLYAEQVVSLVAGLVVVLRKHVSDRETLALIGDELGALLNVSHIEDARKVVCQLVGDGGG